MSRQFWVEMLAWATSDATAVANTTSETVLYPNITIPANYMQDGRCLRLRFYGKYSTTATPTMIFGSRWGGVAGTLLTKTAAVTTQSGVTNAVFQGEIMIQTRANGSSGSLLADGEMMVFANTAPTVASATGVGAAALTPFANGGQITPAAVTVDLTADTALATTLTWSAASASNTATGMHLELASNN